MKNIGRAIIALCTSSVLSFAGAAEWQDKNTGIWWSYSIQDDGTASIESAALGSNADRRVIEGDVEIPDKVNGRTVSSIGNEAFGLCSKLTSVTIPSGITSIGDRAFLQCIELRNVIIPSSVQKIGQAAFRNCIRLVAIQFDGVEEIGNEAFQSCEKIESVMIPSTATVIGGAAFKWCHNLSSVEINEGVESIGKEAFYGCEQMTSITIPGSVVQIGDYAFVGCKLERVDIKEGAKSICDYAFYQCHQIKYLQLPSSITNVGTYAFSRCGLTNVNLSAGLTSIREGAFSECNIHPEIVIPEGVTNIEQYAFGGGYWDPIALFLPISIKSIDGSAFLLPKSSKVLDPETKVGEVHIKDIKAWCSVKSNGIVQFGLDRKLFVNEQEVHDLVIPEGVTEIEGGAFFGYGGIATLTLPQGLKKIGAGAFYGCMGLKDVIIPDSVTEIGAQAFYGCEGLCNCSLVIPEGVTSIGSHAFYSPEGLGSVTIPPSVKNVGELAFYPHGSKCLLTVFAMPGDVERVEGLLNKSGMRDLCSVRELELKILGPSWVESGGCVDLSCRYCDRDSRMVQPVWSITVGSEYASFDCATGLLQAKEVPAPRGVMVKAVYDGVVGWWGVSVVPTPISLTISGASSVESGTKEKYLSVANYVDGTSKEWLVTWSLADGSDCATIDSVTGELTARWVVSAQEVTVVATCDGRTQTKTVTILPKAVENANHLYCVIDLAGGISAANYPVTYLNAEPDEGWSYEYKTTKLVMRRIEAGTFSMHNVGSVNLPQPFFIGVFEVTQKQWELVMGSNPSTYKGDSRPVESIAYDDVYAFLGALRNKTGLRVDFPKESQWEYSCCAGSMRNYNNGTSVESDMNQLGRYRDDRKDGRGGYSDAHTEVGSYLPNAWGLYDMHGNVNEWCLEWWEELIPDDDSIRTYRAVRGGDWRMDAIHCIASYRNGYNHTVGYDDCGIRLSMTFQKAVTPSMVTYNANGGVCSVTQQTIERGDALIDLPLATRNAYALDGWHTAANGGKRVTSSTVVTDDTTLYAHWIVPPIIYTVSFDTCGGEIMRSKSYEKGARVGDLPVPTRDGYKFVGWYTDTQGGELITVDTVVNGAFTCYAHWLKQYTIRFFANDETDAKEEQVFAYGDIVTLSRNKFVRDGYTFCGWAASADGAAVYADGQMLTVGEMPMMQDNFVFSFYAVWQKNGESPVAPPEDPIVPQSEEGLYCVIDLSGGTGATSYPVTYLNAEPIGGWSDEYKTTKLVLRRIEAGAFKMQNRYEVWLTKPFFIGVFEVTQRQWELVMGSNPSQYMGDARPVERVSYDMIRGDLQGASWPSSIIIDDNSFVGKIQKCTGLNFDLPTEAQWECACCAGTKSDYNDGGSLEADLRAVGRYSGNCDDGNGGYSEAHTKVGSYLPNAWGLYDMHGNVDEWCLDWYGNIGTGVDPQGVSSGSCRVNRGGCYATSSYWCTSFARNYFPSANSDRCRGFRLARTILRADSVTTNTITYVNLQGAANTNVTEFTTNDLPLVLGPVGREGWRFLGWTPNGGVIPAETVTNVTFTANWEESVEPPVGPSEEPIVEPMVTNTITYLNLQGAENTNVTIFTTNDLPLVLGSVEREGWRFLGWTPNGGVIPAGTVTNVTFAALWEEIVEPPPEEPVVEPVVTNTITYVGLDGAANTNVTEFTTNDLPLVLGPVEREGWRLLGWAPNGGVIPVGTVTNVTFAAQWEEIVEPPPVEQPEEPEVNPWCEDADFSAVVANTYDGYMIDEGYNLLGIVQVKTTKQVVKKTTDRVTKAVTVTTNITATATVTDANGKKWSYSKGVVTVDGVVTGLKCTTKGCPVPEFGVKVGANGMEGAWGENAIFGARNGMGTKGDAMMAALEAYKGKWSVTIGKLRLQLNVQAKEVVKIAGNWENGAKVSASAQLVMGDGFVYVPVMVKSTKTSPAVNALLRIDAGGEVVLLSEGELVKGGRTVEALGEPDYLPSEVSAGGKAFSARVAINELAYPAKFAAKKLPAGLKIDSATGVISGTPTKPGRYVAEVTVTSGLNSRVRKTMTVEFDIANYTDGLIPVRDSYGPYYVGVSADERITAAAGCSVSGLPAGLKWTAKAIVDAKTKTIKTAANTVYGMPSKAGISTVYFKKTVKEPVNGRMKSVTHQASATFVVEGMQPWAIGTFDGGSSNGIVTLTVAKTGKISGKWMSGGLTWTLSAASFDAYISSEQMYVATVIGKSGKLMMTNEIEVTESGVVAFGVRGEDAASTTWEAWRNGWKEEPLKTLATKLKGQKVQVGEVLLTVGSSGAVTAKGSFVTGFDEKKQKDIIYSASCSTVLIPTAEAGQYRVYLYFPPKTGKFDGFTDVVEIGFGDSQ